MLNSAAVKLLTRPLRALLLAWSLLLTTQLALVHGYVHQQQAQSGASRQAGEPEKAMHEQLCKLCVSLSQFGAAPPSHATAVLLTPLAGEVLVASTTDLTDASLAAHLARGPPVRS